MSVVLDYHLIYTNWISSSSVWALTLHKDFPVCATSCWSVFFHCLDHNVWYPTKVYIINLDYLTGLYVEAFDQVFLFYHIFPTPYLSSVCMCTHTHILTYKYSLLPVAVASLRLTFPKVVSSKFSWDVIPALCTIRRSTINISILIAVRRLAVKETIC